MISITEIVYFFKGLSSALNSDWLSPVYTKEAALWWLALTFTQLLLRCVRSFLFPKLNGHELSPSYTVWIIFLEEAAVLNTCNGMEIYVLPLSQHRGVKEVTKWMSKVDSLSPYVFSPSLDDVILIFFLCRQVESQFQRFVRTVSRRQVDFCCGLLFFSEVSGPLIVNLLLRLKYFPLW